MKILRLCQIKYKKNDIKFKHSQNNDSNEEELILTNENENEKKILANLYFEVSKPTSNDFNSNEYINKAILFGYVMVS